MSNPFVILRFPVNGDGRESEPATIYTDGFTGALYLDEPAEVDRYARAFTGIWNACGSPAARPPAAPPPQAAAMFPSGTTPDSAAGARTTPMAFLNTERNPGPGYLMLHQSGCPHFTRSPLHWTKDYIKLSTPDRASLEDWASTLGDVKYCRTCFR